MDNNQLDPRVVGEAIANMRKSKGKTQEVLSGLAAIGRTHLSAIERGERKPSLETVWRLAAALDMRHGEFVTQIERYIGGDREE